MINGRTTINVQMAPSVVSGDELVIVGYGKAKRSNL